MSKFRNRLEAMNAAWKETESGFADVPEGEYIFVIQSAEVKETQSGNLRATFRFVVSKGEHEGESILDGFTLAEEERTGIRMLKGLLEKLGYEVPETMPEIEDVLAQVNRDNPVVTGRVVKKGDFTNVRVLALAEKSDARPANESPTEGQAVESAEETTEPDAGADFGGWKEGDAASFQTDEEGKLSGVIESLGIGQGGNVATVRVGKDSWEGVPIDQLERPAEAKRGPRKAAPAASRGMREKLLEFALSNGIHVEPSDSELGLKVRIQKARINPAHLTPGELAILDEAGIKLEKAAPAPKKATPTAPKKATASPGKPTGGVRKVKR